MLYTLILKGLLKEATFDVNEGKSQLCKNISTKWIISVKPETLMWQLEGTFKDECNGNPLQCSCLENPRTAEPGGLPSTGSHRVGHDWSDLAAAAEVSVAVVDWASGDTCKAEVRELGKSRLWGTRESSEVCYHELWGLFLFWWEEGDGWGGESWTV